MTTLLLCKDCHYFLASAIKPDEFSRCLHGYVRRRFISRVTGEITVTQPPGKYCDVERGMETSGHCGPEAAYFEPKTKQEAA